MALLYAFTDVGLWNFKLVDPTWKHRSRVDGLSEWHTSWTAFELCDILLPERASSYIEVTKFWALCLEFKNYKILKYKQENRKDTHETQTVVKLQNELPELQLRWI